MLAFAGGKGGVGTTTIALNSAVAFAEQGRRVVLIDANPRGGDIAAYCGIRERRTIEDVLAGRYSLRRALLVGPRGIRVLAGVWGSARRPDDFDGARNKFLRQIGDLAPSVDTVVVDLGCLVSSWTKAFWREADAVMLCTKQNLPSVMDAYAMLKSAHDPSADAALHLVVNEADSPEVVQEVRQRLARVAHRFLNTRLSEAYGIARCEMISASTERGKPLVLSEPNASATRDFQRLVDGLGSESRVVVKLTGSLQK